MRVLSQWSAAAV